MTRSITTLLLFCAISFLAPLAASAVPITVPTDLNVGDKYRLAFVTSTTRDATSSVIGEYNDFVTAVAAGVPELAALGTTWTAIGSTSLIDARDNTLTNPNVSTGDPIYRLDDTRIADDNADLWDSLLAAPLRVDETGTLLTIDSYVWTGTDPGGTANIANELGSALPVIGRKFDVNFAWLATASVGQTQILPVYAMSAELTVVPEPSTIFLA